MTRQSRLCWITTAAALLFLACAADGQPSPLASVADVDSCTCECL